MAKIWSLGLVAAALVASAFVSVPAGAEAAGSSGTATESMSRLDASQNGTCVVLGAGEIQCWGNMGANMGLPYLSSPMAVSGISDAVGVSLGDRNVCAVRATGHVACFGGGNLAPGQPASEYLTAVPVPGITTATSVSTSIDHSCAVLDGGGVRCWGSNSPTFFDDGGALGDGTTVDSETPVAVSGISNATAVSVSHKYSCALLATAEVQCWGNNRDSVLGSGALLIHGGQFGNGTTTSSLVPVSISGFTGATAISAGSHVFCALFPAGEVKCSGSNKFGRLGAGDVSNSTIPIPVVGISNATAISIDSAHGCAVLTTGNVKCWGFNSPLNSHPGGQLGDGTFTDSNVAVTVNGIDNAVAVTTGTFHTCATLDTDEVKCWGSNYLGLLGNGAEIHEHSAVPVLVDLQPSTIGPPSAPSYTFDDPPPFRVVSLGDSYTAGNGAEGFLFATDPDSAHSYFGGPCNRNLNAYAFQYVETVQQLGVDASLQHLACSGAVADDLVGQIQSATDPQSVQLYVLTIGGNDASFQSIARDCLVLGIFSCDSHLDDAENDLQLIIDKTEDVLDIVQSRSPSASVLLVGYPALVSPRCPVILGGVAPEVQEARQDRIDALQGDFDAAQAGLAQSRPRVGFVSVRDAFESSGPCESINNNGIPPLGGGLVHHVVGADLPGPLANTDPFLESFHPNRFGHTEIAQLLIDTRRHVVCGGRYATVDIRAGESPTADDDVVIGTSGDDWISTSAGDDVVCGFSGDDIISTGSGKDIVFGGAGADLIAGQGESDVLLGQGGNDRIYGGAGSDHMFGGSGNDDLRGQGGPDFMVGDGGIDMFFGGSGHDSIWTGAGGNAGTGQVVRGQSNNDLIVGSSESDVLEGGAGLDSIFGGSGDDILKGGLGADELHGQAGDDRLEGGPTRDVLRGGDDNDELLGGTGNDQLFGDGGNDALDGQGDNDACDGGPGADSATAACEALVGVP